MAGYGSVSAADAYFLARGVEAWALFAPSLKAASLIRGSTYVDGRYLLKFSGTKTGGRAQERAWPRTGAEDSDGAAIDPNVVPVEVEQASYEAALIEGTKPGSLTPVLSGSNLIKSKTVGALSVEYFEPGGGILDLRPMVILIDEILAPIITRIVVPVLVV